MSIASTHLTVGELGVQVVYKNIKNLHISVHPPAGRVRVAAPLRLGEDAIRLAIIQRMEWIKQQRKRLQDAERQTERKMLSGESHYVWGQRLLLDVSLDGRSRVDIRGKTLWLTAPADASSDERWGVLERWYRRELKAAIANLIAKWQPIIGREVTAWTVRRMKTKWGTCNPGSGRIWFNLELAKKNPRCLEYIVVHEMIHLLESRHGDRFIVLMDQYLPNWRALRDELNAAPLADERWAED